MCRCCFKSVLAYALLLQLALQVDIGSVHNLIPHQERRQPHKIVVAGQSNSYMDFIYFGSLIQDMK